MSIVSAPNLTDGIVDTGSGIVPISGGIVPSDTTIFDFTTGVFPISLTFARASSATFTNNLGIITAANNNVPRFDYDPTTLLLSGLYAEEQRTNLLSPSLPSTASGWAVQNVTLVPTAAVSPDGTTNASTSTEISSSSAHYQTCPTTLVVTSGSPYTLSAFFKAGTSTFAQLVLGNGFDTTNFYANFDIVNGVLGTVGSSVTAKIQKFPNGWFRCSIMGTALASVTANAAFAHANNIASYPRLGTYTGTTNNFSIYGAQFELGPFITSYIPTTAAAATRAVDLITATPLPWFNPAQGAFVTNFIPEGIVTAVASMWPSMISDGTSNNYIGNFANSITGAVEGQINIGGTSFSSSLGNTIVAGSLAKLGISYNSGANLACFNGTLLGAGTFGASALPTGLNKLSIANTGVGTRPLSGWIKSFTYYGGALTSAQLQAATT